MTVIDDLARAAYLAVVSDFDGTLAPFAVDRYSVQANGAALAALQRLAAAARTTAAVLSGRDVEGLRRVCHLEPPVIFGGSHGAETAPATGGEITGGLDDAGRAHLEKMKAAVEDLVARHPGTEVELKPYQVVLHARELQLRDPAAAEAALQAATTVDPSPYPFTLGKSVAEFSATTATKGTWLGELRERLEAETGQPVTLVFLGDDLTDEDGFAALDYSPADGRVSDVGIKVGDGETAGNHRLADVEAVAEFLTQLADARSA
ncbi:trehalose-phosphatase [uncultured Corynebacterium sp.]|uniref:trehalose-phosphatase n=1 Tax=uncultured Corynebacterium sp. TaxID=159447 RepID=UPI0025FE7AC4|nr:trehalose-phosphatase [uncultured Corynebacterium sp.]